MTKAGFERAPTDHGLRRFCHLSQIDTSGSNDSILYQLLENLTYECPCKTIESLKLVKITTFDQNQFMTCYLILDFRPTYFSFFRKITALSIPPNVKREVGPNGPVPVVKGLIS